MNEIDDLWLEAYENAKLYKERTKKSDDMHIQRKKVEVGKQVLLQDLSFFLASWGQGSRDHTLLLKFFHMELLRSLMKVKEHSMLMDSEYSHIREGDFQKKSSPFILQYQSKSLKSLAKNFNLIAKWEAAYFFLSISTYWLTILLHVFLGIALVF